jgi:hypothetical protein
MFRPSSANSSRTFTSERLTGVFWTLAGLFGSIYMGTCLWRCAGKESSAGLLLVEAWWLAFWLGVGVAGFGLSRKMRWAKVLLIVLLPVVAMLALGFLGMCLVLGGDVFFRTFCIVVLPCAIVSWVVCHRSLRP